MTVPTSTDARHWPSFFSTYDVGSSAGIGSVQPLLKPREGRSRPDGEVFAVRVGPGGRHDLRWLSGPNPGYGFTLVTSSGEPLTSEQLEAAVREFLSGISPATGYLD